MFLSYVDKPGRGDDNIGMERRVLFRILSLASELGRDGSDNDNLMI